MFVMYLHILRHTDCVTSLLIGHKKQTVWHRVCPVNCVVSKLIKYISHVINNRNIIDNADASRWNWKWWSNLSLLIWKASWVASLHTVLYTGLFVQSFQTEFLHTFKIQTEVLNRTKIYSVIIKKTTLIHQRQLVSRQPQPIHPDIIVPKKKKSHASFLFPILRHSRRGVTAVTHHSSWRRHRRERRLQGCYHAPSVFILPALPSSDLSPRFPWMHHHHSHQHRLQSLWFRHRLFHQDLPRWHHVPRKLLRRTCHAQCRHLSFCHRVHHRSHKCYGSAWITLRPEHRATLRCTFV